MMMVENTGAPLADLAGTNPSTGTARYYFGDNLGSTRRLRNASKTSLGQYEYQPYGEMYAESGATPKYKFAGMYYASDLGTYYTLNRFYNPTLARWTTRDPLGMVDGANVYGYVRQAPIRNSDFLGLKMGYCEALYTACIFDCNVAANTARVTLAMLLIDCIGACHAIIEVPILYACCLVTCWDVYNKAVGGIEKVRSACESGCAWLYKICTGNSPGP